MSPMSAQGELENVRAAPDTASNCWLRLLQIGNFLTAA